MGFATRQYTVHIPRGYDPQVEHPVVLLFHNALKDGAGVIKGTDFTRIADREGLVLIAPDSPDATRPWFGADDVEFTKTALREVGEFACLDRTRVYALGHGGGGNFATTLRCKMPLSAIVTASTGEYVSDQMCEADPTPLLRFYGTKDRHVPMAGGEGCFDKNNFRSAAEIAELWRERNQTTTRGVTWTSHKRSKCELWEGGAPFVSCALDGGHDWPTAPTKVDFPWCTAPAHDFPMTDTTWRFFKEFGRALPETP